MVHKDFTDTFMNTWLPRDATKLVSWNCYKRYARYNTNAVFLLGWWMGRWFTWAIFNVKSTQDQTIENVTLVGGNIKLYDGFFLATATANNQVDLYTVGWGRYSITPMETNLIASVYQGVFGVTLE